MKKFTLVFIFLISLLMLDQSNSFAQLTGSFTIPINGVENPPFSFQSLKSVVSYVTTNGVNGSGQVVLEFQTGYDAAADTAAGTSITIPNIIGTSASLGITFRPATGFNTKISISIIGAGSIILNGAKYITFDGRQGGSGVNGLTIQNGTNSATASTSAFQLINDAQFNTLTFLNINSALTNSASSAATILFGTSTGTLGNSNNTISNNTFGPAGTFTSCSYHIISNGTAGVLNSTNTISNNNLTNYVFRAIVITGTGSGDAWSITGNSFYSTLVGTGTQRGVNFITGSGSGHTISNNFFGGQAASCGGSAYTANAFIAIDINVGSGTATSVQGNTIKNFNNTFTSTGIGFEGINIAGGNVNVGTISGNFIGTQSDTGNVRINTTSGVATTIFTYGIVCVGSGTINIQNNAIGSITLNPIAITTSSIVFRAISNESATLTSLTISNNKIGHNNAIFTSIRNSGTGRPVSLQGIVSFGSGTISSDSIRCLKNSTTGGITGIAFFSGVTGQSLTVSNNAVNYFTQTLSATGTETGFLAQITASSVTNSVTITGNVFDNFGSTVNSAVAGVTLTNSGSLTSIFMNGSVTGNTISNLFNQNTGTSAVVYGVQVGNSSSTSMDVSSNNINTLTAATLSTANTSTSAVFGIGVPSSQTALTVNQNNINTLSCTGSAASTHVIGIGVFGGGTITRNRIYGITNPNAATTGTIKGIVMRSTGLNFNVINNQITLSPTNDIGVYGMENNSASTQINVYFNSVLISGTASGTNNTTAFFRNGAAVNTPVDLRNNILSNIKTGGSGNHVCVINNSTTPATGWDTTGGKNNNNFLIIPVGATNVGIWNGSNLTFAGWKSTTICDNLSISAVNTAGTSSSGSINTGNYFTAPASGNLNIQTANTEAWFSKGTGSPISTVTNDYSGTTRSGTVVGGSPCIGSHEYTPASTPPIATPSAAPAPSSTTTYTFAGKVIGSITWDASVNPPTNIDAQLFSGTYPANSNLRTRSNSYWVFTATGGSGYSYNITLNYDPADLGDITSNIDIRIAKSASGSDWTLLSNSFTTLDSVAHTITYSGLNSFSQFTLTDADIPLPVELASFTSIIDNRNVELKWSTSTEINNAGFDIERKVTGTNNVWSKVGNVAGHGTSSVVNSYSFKERNLPTANYNYRLKQMDNNGNFKYYNLSNEVIVGIPTQFSISQNYPNPFNPTTKINYDLPFDSKVSIVLFDMTGRQVAEILNTTQQAGYQTVQFNASNLSSGTYFYQINAAGGSQSFSKTLKMMLIK